MDIHIQGTMDGIELAAALQESHDIPIIYLTAFSEEKALERAKKKRVLTDICSNLFPIKNCM